MTVVHYIRMGLSLAISMQGCFGANVTVLIANAPKNADSVLIAVDRTGSVAPVVQAIKPNADGGAVIAITLSGTTNARFRAIAVQHHGTSIFPFISAAIAVETKGGINTVLLDFGTQPISITIGQMVDMGDGTLTVPVTFSGGGAFFFVNQIVDLWVSPTNTRLIAGGALFLAPLIQEHSAATFMASFVIPVSIASGIFEVGYHALDFRMSNPEIPLFATPYIQLSGLPFANGLSPANGSEQPALTTQPVPIAPGTSRVAVGPGGRLIRVFEPTNVTPN